MSECKSHLKKIIDAEKIFRRNAHRDELAKAAMQSIVIGRRFPSYSDVARNAYDLAEEMLDERAKRISGARS